MKCLNYIPTEKYRYVLWLIYISLLKTHTPSYIFPTKVNDAVISLPKVILTLICINEDSTNNYFMCWKLNVTNDDKYWCEYSVIAWSHKATTWRHAKEQTLIYVHVNLGAFIFLESPYALCSIFHGAYDGHPFEAMLLCIRLSWWRLFRSRKAK